MAELEILGRVDGGYRIGVGSQTALVSDALLASEFGRADISRADAEEWIAAQSYPLSKAIDKIAAGGKVPAPFDQITLEREA